MTTLVETTATLANEPEQKRVSRKSQAIATGQLILTDDFRFRIEDDESTIGDYEEVYKQYRDDRELSKSLRCPLGAITVLCEGEGRYVVVAGRLRFLAAQRAGLETLQCVVVTDREEAIRIGLEDNRHGLPLTGQDRAKCIRIAITRLSGLSNRRIAAMIGCAPRTVDGIVTKYKLRSDTPLVEGLDGKGYRQKKGRKAPKAEKATAGTPDLAVVDNGSETDDASQTAAVKATSDRPFDKVRAILEPTPTDDRQRVHTYLDIVKDIVAEGFSEESSRQEFLKSLKAEFFRK